MPPHRPIDPSMVATFWQSVSRVGVTGREVAAHTGLDESAISRMRTQQSPTPLDVALHTLDLTGPRPMVSALAQVGLDVSRQTIRSTSSLSDSSIELVSLSTALLRAVHDQERDLLLEHIEAAADVLSQMRAAAMQRKAS